MKIERTEERIVPSLCVNFADLGNPFAGRLLVREWESVGAMLTLKLVIPGHSVEVDLSREELAELGRVLTSFAEDSS